MALENPQHNRVIQHQAAYIEPQEASPEKQLLYAVLSRAIRDYIGDEKLPKRCASHWLFFSKKTDEFSFIWICRELDLGVKEIRNLILQKQNDPLLMDMLTRP